MWKFFSRKNTAKEVLEEIGNRFIKDFDGFIDKKVLDNCYNDIISNNCKELSIDLLMFNNYVIAVSNIVVTKNLNNLKRDYHIGVKKDEYGIENRDRWNDTLKKVVDNIAIDLFCNKSSDAINSLDLIEDVDRRNFLRIIDKDRIMTMTDNKLVDVFINNISFFVEHEITYGRDALLGNSSFDNVSSGVEYEYVVAKFINEYAHGWSANVTKASGDQGLDIMAIREDGVAVAIQAKFYSAPVGNKAVQEVVAARGFYNTNFAVVVSNSPFTKSAIDLALASNVELLHHNSLIDYFARLQ